MSTWYFPTSRLSKTATLLVLFVNPFLATDWWATMKHLELLLFWALPISTWYSNCVSKVYLSVLHENNGKIKLLLIESLNVICVSALGTHIAMNKYKSSKLISLSSPNVVKIISCKSAVLNFIWNSICLVTFLNVQQNPKKKF